ncbi:hypothetical protein ACW23B_08145 [Streptomyces albidoflavus]
MSLASDTVSPASEATSEAAPPASSTASPAPSPTSPTASLPPAALPDALDGLARPLARLLDGLPGALAQLPYRLACTLAQVLRRGTEPGGDLLQDLRVPVDGGEHPADDRGDVVEPDVEQGLRVHALDVQLHAGELDIGADVQLEEAQHLGLEGDPGPQLLDLEIDLVHVELRDVEVDVRIVGRPGGRRGRGRSASSPSIGSSGSSSRAASSSA